MTSNQIRIRTKGGAEIIVKRWLEILRKLITEFGLKIQVVFVLSEKNKADVVAGVKSPDW